MGVDLSQRIGDWAVHRRQIYFPVMGPRGSVRNGRTSLRPIGQKFRRHGNDKVCGAGIKISIFIQGLG